ncbi:hypothetical protein AB0I49_04960 [Streptomyces sp. NPDC050617]|uniref:hypothetical protein n=1 Tax=Streptomyces sp. NPDC050617 TaxID=3154628 RepID=UPI00341EBA76
MDEHDDEALHAAFRDVLDARPEPSLPSVTDAAVQGGRRLRRRRAALSAAGVVAVVAAVTMAVGAVRSGGAERDPLPVPPMAPADTTSPTPRVSIESHLPVPPELGPSGRPETHGTSAGTHPRSPKFPPGGNQPATERLFTP